MNVAVVTIQDSCSWLRPLEGRAGEIQGAKEVSYPVPAVLDQNSDFWDARDRQVLPLATHRKDRIHGVHVAGFDVNDGGVDENDHKA